MSKRLVLSLVVAFLLIIRAHEVSSAVEAARYEVGGQYTAIHLNQFEGPLGPRTLKHQFGGRLTYNLTEAIAVETEVSFAPRDSDLNQQRIQAVFGIKAGKRKETWGLFGKVRPGFLRINEKVQCVIPEGCGPVPLPEEVSTNLLIDIGGVFELYPSNRWILRFEAGDSIIHFSPGVEPIDGQTRDISFTTHNLQVTAGIGFGF